MSEPGARRAWAGAILRATWFKVIAALAATAALVTGAFVAGGYDIAQTKVDDSSVWALQTGQGDRYARVNTALGELETVKGVDNPSDLVQSSGHVLLYAQNDAKVAAVSLSQPAELSSDPSGFSDTPAGTTDVVHSGDFVGYLTGTGQVYAARLSTGAKSPDRVQPSRKRGSEQYSSDAIAVGTDGVLYSYSHTEGAVLRYDIRTGRVLGTDPVPKGPTRPNSTLTVVGDVWALLNGAGTELWIEGLEKPVATGLSGKAVLQQSSSEHPFVAVADQGDLRAFDLKAGTSRALLSPAQRAEGLGTPAAPNWSGAQLYAAWLPNSGPGTLWSARANLDGVSKGRARQLDYGARSLDQDPVPVFRTNGSRVILNDSTSGWVWSVPDGALVSGSQDWAISDASSSSEQPEYTDSTKVTDPVSPVAENDRFGVRAGSLVTLPVMSNDHDANDDVLSIVPDSVKGLDPAFGVASVANGAQTVTVRVAANPPPTASFSYVITDGTGPDGGRMSQPATVTLEVHAAGLNKPPQPCAGDPGCIDPLPSDIQVAPGSTVSVPVLRGWGDPDGDPVFASTDAANQSYSVSVSPNGTVVFRAAPSAKPGPVQLSITISDIYGATAQQTLAIDVAGAPRLAVENFGLMTAVGVPLTVDPSSHIRGAVGSPRIVSATTTAPDVATVSVDSAGATFGFAASAAGSYPITMTIQDSQTGETQTATVRIIVVDKDQPLLSTAPVTIFVRPQSDTSVDVFNAVQNPTGRVLLLSDPNPLPASGASLDVDVVGQAQLRVRGTTGDEQPGLLGTVEYTVSDGSGAPNLTVRGIATVYYLSDASSGRPVAVDDSVTVRAGAQVDIPVLANDVGPNGDALQLDPSSIRVGGDDGLAFASGQVLRYLAPARAGKVVLQYSAYIAGEPTNAAQATVTVTVLPPGGNRPPQPVTLTGRVIAGASVRIPFSSYGVDPDGDTVALDRIVQQPQDGSAQIAADGSAIIYSSLAGTHSQEQFTYQVRDALGETGTATVMVGVLNAQTDPAPVTFSDYVQVQAGEGNQVVIQPTANDIDPAGTKLALGQVTPNAVEGTTQYTLFKQHLGKVEDDRVVVTATDTPRTLTYTYTVRNGAGDIGAGLIVVKVVSGKVPDYPVVSDTVVGAQQRSQLDSGIDVVTGKVSWGAGDVSTLKLSLWGKPPGVSVDGDSLKVAQVPASGLLVPFKLSGVDFTGQPAYSYGFLRIPALANVILALKSDAQAQTVKEGGKTTFDMADLVTVPDGSVLSVQQGRADVSRTRKNASCVVEGTNVTYVAGTGAPWLDWCEVPVRLVGQQNYTLLAVPISVTPLQPEPQLRPASLTVVPGSSQAFNLEQMTSWLSHNDLSGLDYTVTYHGSLFRLAENGHVLTVTANDSARPGLEETASVAIDGFPRAQANITLKVGPAPSQRPAGGSVRLSCSEADGSSCSATAVGLRDETNAYQTPLKLVDVQTQAAGCEGVTFAVSDARAVTASWPDNAPGGSCSVPFGVEDAQGKRSAIGAGDGTLAFQLQGYPAAPASLAQVGYGASSVTLSIDPGEAAGAFPALSGFRVYLDGTAVAECAANGSCPPITGLKNGEKHVFTARAVNAVGESKQGATTTAWAFAQPVLSSIQPKPIYDAQRTTQTTGWFELSIRNSDPTAASYQVSVAGTPVGELPVAPGDWTTASYSAPPGQPTLVSVTPVSAFAVPHGQPTDAQPAVATVTTAGLPAVGWSPLPTSFATSSSAITVQGDGQFDSNGSALGENRLYAAVVPGGDPNCTFNQGASNPIGVSAVRTSSSKTIDGLQQFASYDVYVCYTNQYGIAQLKLNGSSPVVVWDRSGAPTPSGCRYSITQHGGGLPDYEFDGAPSCDSGQQSGVYSLVISGFDAGLFGAVPSISAKYCALGGLLCGPSVTVDRASGSAAYQLKVSAPPAAQCTPSPDGGATPPILSLTQTLDGQGIPQVPVDITGYEYTKQQAGGWQLATGVTPAPSQNAVDPLAIRFRNIRFRVDWPAGTGFAAYTGTLDPPNSVLGCG